MPVTVIPCSQQSAKKKSTLSRKRRQNENEEIHELASLVPLSSSQLSGLIPSNGGKPQTISVLRLTTTFLKLQTFIKDASSLNDRSNVQSSLGRTEEAIDGFLIVLDEDANILYVSETIAGHVGLIQQDVIGQNLADITYSEFSSNITEGLKPSLIVSTSLVDECVVNQHKQFFVKLKPSVYSTSPSDCLVYMQGNLKVQLSPSKISSSGELEFVEPKVVGFIGECRVVESVASILEISIPHSTYTMTRTHDFEKVISVEASFVWKLLNFTLALVLDTTVVYHSVPSVQEILGYDPKFLCSDRFIVTDFIHPADQMVMSRRPRGRESMIKRGYGVSPFFRFMTSSGEWVWQQVQAKLRYKDGTSIPHFWEAKITVIGGGGGNLKYVERRGLHQHRDDNDIILSPTCTTTKSSLGATLSSFLSSSYNCRPNHEAKSIVDSPLKSTDAPESVLEPVLHGRSVAMNGFVEQMRLVAESETSETTTVQHGRDTACKGKKTDSPQSVSTSCTSDSEELSPVCTSTCSAATTVETPPKSCSISTTSHSFTSTSSATQQPKVSTSQVSVTCSGTKELIPAGPGGTCSPEMIFASKQSHFSPQLDTHVHVQHVQEEESAASSSTFMSNLLPKHNMDQPGVQSPLMSISSTDSSPASSTMPQQEEVITNPEQFLNSAGDCGAPLDLETYLPCNTAITAGFSPPPMCSAEIDSMLHNMSSSDSIPSAVTSVPFHNPNFTPQAPLFSDFNPRIPSSFDFSNNFSAYQSSENSHDFPFTDNSISAASMPTTGIHASNFDISSMLINNDDSLAQQLIIGEDSLMDETSLNTLTTSLPHSAARVDHVMAPFAHSYPQTNLASGSNFTPSLQDPMFCSSTHLNADLVSQVLVDSPTSSSHNPISCSSNAEVQDILQQFM